MGVGQLAGAPDYRHALLLSDVVPAAAITLGAGDILDAGATARALKLGFDTEDRVVVVALIDGLGAELLRARAAHAPFLRGLLPDMLPMSAGFPSTTANSLSSLGTGMLPGAHGIVGYQLRDPQRDVVFNQLTWDPEVEPEVWVPDATMFERLTAAGVDVVSLGEPKFAGRGLNQASLRGGRFRGSKTMAERVAHAVEEARAPGRRLIYFYWGNLDKTGHVHGVDSWNWTEELEEIDGHLARLANSLPADAGLTITADHGMVDLPAEARIDLAEHPQLRDGVTGIGGEPRAVHVYVQPGALETVHAAFAETLGDRGLVMTRAQAISSGFFGPVRQSNLERIGDVIVICHAGTGIIDSAHDSPSALALIGHHGGITRQELAIPLLRT